MFLCTLHVFGQLRWPELYAVMWLLLFFSFGADEVNKEIVTTFLIIDRKNRRLYFKKNVQGPWKTYTIKIGYDANKRYHFFVIT